MEINKKVKQEIPHCQNSSKI